MPANDDEHLFIIEELCIQKLPTISKRTNRFSSVRKLYLSISTSQADQKLTEEYAGGKQLRWTRKLTFLAQKNTSISIQLFAKHNHSADESIASCQLSIEALEQTPLSTDGYRFIMLLGGIDIRLGIKLQFEKHSEALNHVLHDAAEALSPTVWDELIKEMSPLLSIGATLAEVNSITKLAFSLFKGLHDIAKTQSQHDAKVLELVKVITEAITFLADSKELENSMKNPRQVECCRMILLQCVEAGYFIQGYIAHNRGSRMLKGIFADPGRVVQDIKDHLEALKQTFLSGAAVHTQVVVFRVEELVSDIGLELDLSKLPYAGGATFQRSKRCLPGTRTPILAELEAWASHVNARRMLLLLGEAGTGKSSIAHTIAASFELAGRLGSAFCFDRNNRERSVDKFFPTISHDLAALDPAFKKALATIVGKQPAVSTTPDLNDQFEQFLIRPLSILNIVGPIVIVVDALDESGTDSPARAQLLSVLADHLADLDPNVRLLITARPEPDICNAFDLHPHVEVYNMPAKQDSYADIQIYVNNQLQGRGPDGLLRGVTRDMVSVIVSQSEGLFQYASVVCYEIKYRPPGESISEWFQALSRPGTSNNHVLDMLYTQILSRFNMNRAQVRQRFHCVMGWILALREPLRKSSLIALMNSAGLLEEIDGTDSISFIVDELGSLLSGISMTDTSPLQPLHTSFRDYLLDSSRSGPFHISTDIYHTNLAQASLSVLNTRLEFNMLELDDPSIPNTAITNITLRINEVLPLHSELRYALQFWGLHVKVDDSTVEQGVTTFLKTKFLFWLEMLSILNAYPNASPILSAVQQSFGFKKINLGEFQRFIQEFGAAISTSALHVYYSALAFMPVSIPGQKYHTTMFPQIVHINRTKQSGMLVCMWNVGSKVNSVAVTVDGLRVASGSDDGAVRIWDSTTGKQLGPTLNGHTDAVRSVAFSPSDGQRVVSGSSDGSVRIWDSATGQQLGPTLDGHTDAVRSVAFSPDGQRLASGSSDKSIRIWDSISGNQVGPALEGHTEWVRSVAFSPDGQRLVSGSDDRSVRIWDITTGKQLGHAFEGHADTVQSVAFSPDGQKVVSGSLDKTVRIWDSTTGEQLGRTLKGHTDTVQSAVFSPDGQRLVTCSFDRSVRMWNPTTGQQLGAALEGHTDYVQSLAFFADGTRVVSGSGDKTVRIWHCATDEELDSAPDRPAQWIESVAFSDDGQRVLSASLYRSVCVWDSSTAQQIAPALVGLDHWVWFIAFSPDKQKVVSGSDNGSLFIWDTTTGKQIAPTLAGHTDAVWCAAFSPDGQRLVSGSSDQTVRIWDSDTGQQLGPALEGHTETVQSVAFSPDGQKLVSGSSDRSIRIWNTTTGEQLGPALEGHTDTVRSVAFAPKGWERVVSGSADRSVRIWDSTTCEQVGPAFEGHTDWVQSVAYSPDGQRVASGSLDKSVRIWDPATGNQLGYALEGHNHSVRSVVFSPDGQRLVSGSADGSVRIWAANKPDISPPVNPTQSLYSILPIVSNPVHADKAANLSRLRLDRRTGWVKGPNDELVIWVPYGYHDNLNLYPQLGNCGHEPLIFSFEEMAPDPGIRQYELPV